MELLKKIESYASEKTQGTEYFVVEVLQSKSGKLVSVLLDGDTSIPISKCSEIGRHISARIDEEIPDEVGAFTVEVSSPGVERPLRLERQYAKHINRTLAFSDDQGVSREGILKEVSDGIITIHETVKEKGKKQQVLENTYKIINIIDPKVVVSFKR